MIAVRVGPRRYQRTRNVAADIPVEAVYVGRPTKWGNPWKIGDTHPELGDPMPAADVVVLYRDWLFERGAQTEVRLALRGKDLVCWCSLDAPCHADVLLEVANA